MTNRRSFFTKLGLLAAGITAGPQLFIPKLIEPARWRMPRGFPSLPDLGVVGLRAKVVNLIGAEPPYLRPWDGIGSWNQVETLVKGALRRNWEWTGPGAPPSAFPAYEGGPNPRHFLAAHDLAYPDELCQIMDGHDAVMIIHSLES